MSFYGTYGIASGEVRVECANLAQLNRIRAAARKHRATVEVNRYARDAYEGRVIIPTRWDEGKAAHDARIAAIRAVVQGK